MRGKISAVAVSLGAALTGSCSALPSPDESDIPTSLEPTTDIVATFELDPSDVAAAVLASSIRYSRRQALASGTRPVPSSVWRLLRIAPDDARLAKTRWTVNRGQLAIDTLIAGIFDDDCAITFGDVIVFCNERAAQHPYFWAHELAHVRQYQVYGIDGFAVAYVRDWRSLERGAKAQAKALVRDFRSRRPATTS